jgi:hypothetical protein
MAMRGLVVLMIACAGCDRVFGLERDVDAAGGSDGAVADGADAMPCVGNGHDEDDDQIADNCDACPTVDDPDQADRDGDGVGDACDPHPDVANDRVVMFEPFSTVSALGGFTIEHGNANIVGDAVQLSNDPNPGIITTDLLTASTVVARMRFQDPVAEKQAIAIVAAQTEQGNAGCITEVAAGSGFVKVHSVPAPTINLFAEWPTAGYVAELRLEDVAGETRCTASDAPVPPNSPSSLVVVAGGAFTPGRIRITSVLDPTTPRVYFVDSIIAYGPK